MNCSGYFILAFATILVVLVNHSDAVENGFNNTNSDSNDTIKYILETSKQNEEDGIYVAATRILRDYYINGTMAMLNSEEIMYKGINSAKELLKEDSEAAKNTVKKACDDGLAKIFDAGIVLFLSQGGALSLSESGVEKGLKEANILTQDAGFTLINMLDGIDYLLRNAVQVETDDGEALLKAVYQAIKSAYIGLYSNIRKSFGIAIESLRHPLKGPFKEQNCTTALNDSGGEKAIRDINEAADIAIKRGANAEMIEKFRRTFTCSISKLVNSTTEGQKTIDDIRSFTGIEPLAVKITYFKRYATVKKALQVFSAKIYLLIGRVAFNYNKVSSDEIRSAIMAVEMGLTEVMASIKAAGDFISIGQRHPGRASSLAVDAAETVGIFGKVSYLKKIINGCKLALSVISG